MKTRTFIARVQRTGALPVLVVLVVLAGCAASEPGPREVRVPPVVAPDSGGAREPAAAPRARASLVLPPGFREVRGAGYTFGVPEGWTRAEHGIEATLVLFRAPPTRDDFTSSAQLSAQPFDGTTDDFAATLETELSFLGPMRRTPARLAGRDALDLEITVEGRMLWQRAAVIGARGWVVACAMAAPGSPDDRAVCEAIFDSVQIE